MQEEIKKAKELLKANGYAIIKITQDMDRDMEECVELEKRGKDKDCRRCSCSICLMLM